MSAIGGIVAYKKTDTPIVRYLHLIMSHLAHRGSHDEGYLLFDGEESRQFAGSFTAPQVLQNGQYPPLDSASPEAWLGLGHRLHNPADAEINKALHQPMPDAEQRFWITFDGDIVNYNLLADELRKEGVELQTKSQAEVVLKGYMAWQERVLSKLEGGFAFVIYDRTERKLFGARDRFGIRPLYYMNDADFFCFGSEQKSLIKLPFVSKKVSKSAVYDYLVLGLAESGTQSMFRGLSELMPGCAFSMLLPNGNMKVWGYFHLTTDSKIDRYSRNKVSTLSHRLKKALVANVSSHLSPGQKTAYRLDGSLESLVFPYLIKEFLEELPAKERPKASDIYCGVFGQIELPEHLEEAEIRQAQSAMKDLEINMIDSVCTFKDFTDELLKVCYHQDVPFTSLDVFAQSKMLKVARQNEVKMVIEPIGAAQLFSSAPYHYDQYLQDLLQKGAYNLFFQNYFGSPLPFSHKWAQLRTLTREYVFKSSSDDLKETFIKASSEEFSYLKDSFTDRYFKNLDEKIKSSPLNLNQLLVSELSGPMIKEKLRTSDRNARFCGVEIRYPFVSDKEMAEAMIKASSVYKIRAGEPASLLKKAMRGIWPEHILKTRGIANHTQKENAWLLQAKEELKEFLTSDLDDFIDSRKIKKDWDKLVLMADGSRNEFLWRVINLAVWRHVYFG